MLACKWWGWGVGCSRGCTGLRASMGSAGEVQRVRRGWLRQWVEALAAGEDCLLGRGGRFHSPALAGLTGRARWRSRARGEACARAAARRMHDLSQHLLELAFPQVPIRQSVISPPSERVGLLAAREDVRDRAGVRPHAGGAGRPTYDRTSSSSTRLSTLPRAMTQPTSSTTR